MAAASAEYHTFYKIASKIEEEKEYSKRKGVKKIARSLKMHPTNINQKVEIIIEHFKHNVKHLLDGTAKAMVITDSRLQAVKYFLAFKRYIHEHGYSDIRALVAFSGEVEDSESGEKYTEPKLNIDVSTGKTITEKQLPEKFATLDYCILLVANKYQTDFDEPRLCAIYVDKRLDNVQAVQTLSRLNRCFPGKEEQEIFYNKLKSFVNLYAIVIQIITYSDEEWEKLYTFSRHLLPHIGIGEIDIPENPQENIVLTHLRNQKIAEHRIDLSDGERLFFEQILEKAQQHEEVVRKVKTNSYDKFELGIKEIIKDIMMQRIKENDGIVSRYFDDDEFQKIALTLPASEMYGNIN